MPITFNCDLCGKQVTSKRVGRILKNKISFCSDKCLREYIEKTNVVIKPCANCGSQVRRRKAQADKSKSNNVFCNSSCAAIYNNAHKTKGTRISKLEIYIQNSLYKMFPSLDFKFNDKTTINSELDIYIPSLRLAVELNGIFHYEPIFGEKKLIQTQNNDKRKFQACLEKGIELLIIDTSSEKYFKETKAKKYLDIVIGIIQQKMTEEEVESSSP